MNAKEAMKITSEYSYYLEELCSDPYRPEAFDIGQANGFLEAVEKFKVVMDCLRRSQEFQNVGHTPNKQNCPKCQMIDNIKIVDESYRRNVLGEE